jgi:hypothetical protein
MPNRVFSQLSGRRRETGRSSASGALGVGEDVKKRERYRDHRVIAHQADVVGDPDMAERLDCAVVEPCCHPARIGKTHVIS